MQKHFCDFGLQISRFGTELSNSKLSRPSAKEEGGSFLCDGLASKLFHGKLIPFLPSLGDYCHPDSIWLCVIKITEATCSSGQSGTVKLAGPAKQQLLSGDVPRAALALIGATAVITQIVLMTVPAARLSTLERARELGKAAGLQFVYIFNVPGHPCDNTYCPGCGTILIRRLGFAVLQNKPRSGLCPKCNVPVAGV